MTTVADLTPTGQRMLYTLPDFYWDNSFVLRVVQAYADEIDRLDGLIDTLKRGLAPGSATDDLKMLTIWETTFGLPVAPPDLTTAQRQVLVKMALQCLDAVAAADVLSILATQLASPFTVQRDTPGTLQDTMTIRYSSTSFMGGFVRRVAKRAWPAHRELIVDFGTGFILDSSLLDEDVL